MVTGIKFTKQRRIIHLKVQQGQALPQGQVNSSTIQWVDVEPISIIRWVKIWVVVDCWCTQAETSSYFSSSASLLLPCEIYLKTYRLRFFFFLLSRSFYFIQRPIPHPQRNSRSEKKTEKEIIVKDNDFRFWFRSSWSIRTASFVCAHKLQNIKGEKNVLRPDDVSLSLRYCSSCVPWFFFFFT